MARTTTNLLPPLFMVPTLPPGGWLRLTTGARTTNEHVDTDDYGTSGTCFYAGGLGAGDVVTGTAQMYDIATQTWTAIASLPTPVFGAVGGYLSGRFCGAGGFTTTICDWGGTYATQCYNPSTNAWAAAAAIPGTAGGAGGAVGGVTGGVLHVVAGCGTSACRSRRRSGRHEWLLRVRRWHRLVAEPG